MVWRMHKINCPYRLKNGNCALYPIVDPETNKFLGFLDCVVLTKCPPNPGKLRHNISKLQKEVNKLQKEVGRLKESRKKTSCTTYKIIKENLSNEKNERHAMKLKDTANKEDSEFTDISDEESRIYLFPAKDGTISAIRYPNPLSVKVTKSGGHKLVLANGMGAYIKPEWVAIHYFYRGI